MTAVVISMLTILCFVLGVNLAFTYRRLERLEKVFQEAAERLGAAQYE